MRGTTMSPSELAEIIQLLLESEPGEERTELTETLLSEAGGSWKTAAEWVAGYRELVGA